MDFIARAIQKACIDKAQTLFRRADTFLEIDRRAALLIHDAQFDGIGFKTQHAFNMGENLIRESHFFWAMHFGLHHIDGPCDRIARALGFVQVMLGDQSGDHRIHHAFKGF